MEEIKDSKMTIKLKYHLAIMYPNQKAQLFAYEDKNLRDRFMAECQKDGAEALAWG